MKRVLNIPYDTHSNLIPLLVSNTLPFFDEICKDQLDLYCHVSSQNFLLFILLSDTVFLSVVVILLLVEMSCIYVHISNGSLMISSVAMLVLIIMSFCIIFTVVLGMMIGLLLSSWRRFFVSETMILESF